MYTWQWINREPPDQPDDDDLIYLGCMQCRGRHLEWTCWIWAPRSGLVFSTHNDQTVVTMTALKNGRFIHDELATDPMDMVIERYAQVMRIEHAGAMVEALV